MSVEAIAWAKKQRTGSQGANSVLRAIADYADEEGCCWPSRRQIAADTEMSMDTVSRHLAALEAGGIIVREERLRDNGSRSTDMIRLLLNRVPGEPTPSAICGVPPSANCRGPLRKNGEAPSAISGRPEPSLEPSKEDSPQAPQGAGAGISNSDGEGERGAEPDTQFGVFWTQYAADPTASRAKALRAWARLGAADRAQALMMLPRFLDHCRAAKRKICDPSTYLAERRWEGLANVPAPAVRPEATAARPVEADPVKRAVLWALNDKADRAEWHFVEQGSDAWEAWRQAFGAAGFGHRWMAGRHDLVLGRGRSFPLRYPPKPDGSTDPPDGPTAEEMAEFVSSGG